MHWRCVYCETSRRSGLDEKPRFDKLFATTDAGLFSAGAFMQRLSYLAGASRRLRIQEGSSILILCTKMHSPGMAFGLILFIKFVTEMLTSDGHVNANAALLKHRPES